MKLKKLDLDNFDRQLDSYSLKAFRQQLNCLAVNVNRLIDKVNEIAEPIGEKHEGTEGCFIMPCPFCGSEDVREVFHRDNPFDALFYVRCNNCGGRSGDKRTGGEARDAWNRRVADGTD